MDWPESKFVEYYRGIQIERFNDDELFYARINGRWQFGSNVLEEIHHMLDENFFGDAGA